MKSQVNAVKDTPIRIKILKRAFEEGWNLEQVNSELEKHLRDYTHETDMRQV